MFKFVYIIYKDREIKLHWLIALLYFWLTQKFDCVDILLFEPNTRKGGKFDIGYRR